MKCRTGRNNFNTDYPGDMQFLAEEIATEPIPEKLLQLAWNLQRALEARVGDREGHGR